jgi:class 3 adenylate cyclase
MGSAVAQPSGTVTLVFTDIEGSTRLLAELGDAAYRDALDEHRRAVREAFGRHGGYEVDTQGDSFFYAFASARDATSAAEEAIAALEGGRVRIRVGIHTGEPEVDPPNYVGLDVHRAARVMGPDMAARYCSARAPATSSTNPSCWPISASSGSRTSRTPSACSSSGRTRSRR